MLYNPQHDHKPDPLSLPSLIAWLETAPYLFVLGYVCMSSRAIQQFHSQDV